MSNTITLQVGGSLDLNLRLIEPPPAIECIVSTTMGGVTVTAKGYVMAYTLPNDKQVTVQVSYVDAHGNPATVDDAVTWTSSNDALVSVAVDTADSTRAIVRGLGPAGAAQVTATADADLGTGTRSLVTLFDVSIVAGEAVAGTIEPAGEPEPIPATAA